MRVLALETATATSSVAVLDGDRLLGERILASPMRHLEWVLAAADGLLRDLDLGPAEVEAVAVSLGPGSFTGLRIGIATAGAWARARGIPVVGVPTLEAMAAAASGPSLVVPFLDAKRGEVAAAAFRSAGGEMRRVLDDVVAAPETVLREVRRLSAGPVSVLGDGLAAYGDLVRRSLADAVLLPPALGIPRAALVGLLGARRLARGERDDLYHLQPRYGRRPALRG